MREHHRWLLLTASAMLSGCAGTAELFRAEERYHALGHDPGWVLTIESKTLKFVTSQPNSVHESRRPLSEITTTGRRYVTERVTLDIISQPCNDSRSGIAFADTVVVTANEASYRGCGGERVPLLDR
jgi:uncharacterized membrane protein